MLDTLKLREIGSILLILLHVCLLKLTVSRNFFDLLMGFELWTDRSGSDHSTNSAITAGPQRFSTDIFQMDIFEVK